MFEIPKWIEEVDEHTREMILQYGRMYEDIEWTVIRHSQDFQDPDFDPVLNAALHAAATAASEAAQWLGFEGFFLTRESKEWASKGGDRTQSGMIDRAIAKLECAYRIIGQQYIAFATRGILEPRHTLRGPSAKAIQDMINLSLEAQGKISSGEKGTVETG